MALLSAMKVAAGDELEDGWRAERSVQRQQAVI
jgi:hypothetical protein